MCNAERVLLAVLNLCVRIKIRVATFEINHSVTARTQSIAASIHKLPDSVVLSVSTARLRIDVAGETIRVWNGSV
jgi:hypothetical protein